MRTKRKGCTGNPATCGNYKTVRGGRMICDFYSPVELAVLGEDAYKCPFAKDDGKEAKP